MRKAEDILNNAPFLPFPRAANQPVTMLDALPNLAWYTDADSRRCYFNKAWLEFTGRQLNQELVRLGYSGDQARA